MNTQQIRAKAELLMKRIQEDVEDNDTEVWISVSDPQRLEAELDRVCALIDQGAEAPLAGLFFAVKDNIDVQGFDTTAAHPAFSYRPTASAPVVRGLEEAGAIVLGKTNLDQFATGLTGSRSPYGAVHSATFHDRVSGGSSSGSAVAVSKCEVDFALGTDTAGSGRVPAMFNAVFGFKPSCGLTSTDGVVPACRSFDCVSIFSKDFTVGKRVLERMEDPTFPAHNRLGSHAEASYDSTHMLAIPDDAALQELSPIFRKQFDSACAKAREAGYRTESVDMTPFFEVGALLYEGSLVAERFAAVGDFVETHEEHSDPSVRSIILGAKDIDAYQYVREWDVLNTARETLRSFFSSYDALLVPTAVRHPRMEEVAADPIGVNSQLGLFTTFVNLLDLAGISFPTGSTHEGETGASLLVPALHDDHATAMVSDILHLSA